jgi:hypothetical protein
MPGATPIALIQKGDWRGQRSRRTENTAGVVNLLRKHTYHEPGPGGIFSRLLTAAAKW